MRIEWVISNMSLSWEYSWSNSQFNQLILLVFLIVILELKIKDALLCLQSGRKRLWEREKVLKINPLLKTSYLGHFSPAKNWSVKTCSTRDWGNAACENLLWFKNCLASWVWIDRFHFTQKIEQIYLSFVFLDILGHTICWQNQSKKRIQFKFNSFLLLLIS